ncbi:MAG: GNAT family N-acetyltransferase [Gammaproteobacteria bacterium]|nr:GNAT family N-acetyltransferase [Gammaproteobacteria bacterium]
MNDLIIRPATENDIEFLVDGMRAMVRHISDSADSNYAKQLLDNLQVPAEYFQTVLAETHQHILIAQEQAMPCAFIHGLVASPSIPVPTAAPVGKIESCWVDQSQRRKGLAQQLVSAIEIWFEEQQVSAIELSFILGNIEAEVSWAQLGYRPFRVQAAKVLKKS